MTASAHGNKESDFDQKELRRLLAALCDENLSEADAQQLETILARSAGARTFYARYMSLDAGLSWEVTSRASVADLMPARPTLTQLSQQRRRHHAWTWAAVACAASLLIAMTTAIVNRSDPAAPIADGDPTASVGAMAGELESGQIPPVASVTEIAPLAQWAVTPRMDAAPTELRERDVVCVTEGQIQVTFESGAIVTLYAPAMMEVISPMRGRAIRGKLAADVGDGAQGFTIETPRATVVDLGTVFGVEVGDEGATDVVVFKGAVDLHFDGPGGTEEQATPHRLTSGEAVRIDKGGTPSRIVSISSDRFSSPVGPAGSEVTRPVLISTVTDNIDRDRDNWNYYEIVHGGMREDAKAFVDRVAHEWNGLDATGMPEFLNGGDYVKTFNNDKYVRDLELFVTIDHSCRLYVLLDDRVPPPAWLRHQFHDTGYDIGLDVGPFYRVEDSVLVEDRQPGVGPGVAVDEVVSIWECTFDKPQVVHLGSIEADHRYVNMYGIVAVPLEDK